MSAPRKTASGKRSARAASGAARAQGGGPRGEGTESFRGRFAARLDEKGRLLLPAAVRAGLSSRSPAAFVTNSLHQNKPCLHLYSKAGWAELESRIARLPAMRPETQAFQRYYMSGGQELELDGQGRILVPASLREHARLEGAAVLVGMGGYLEIWPAAAWESIEKALAQSFEATMAAVSSLSASMAAAGREAE